MIRYARAEEIPQLVQMGRRFRSLLYDEHIADNAAQMARMAAKLIEQDGLLVSERDGRVVGMIGFIVHDHFLSGERTGGEVFWWVEPEHRGEGLKLMREAEKQARARGAVKMQMVAPNEQVAKVYEHLGYTFVESAYQRAL